MNKIARIHVNQHVIKANAKNGENNPIFTVKQGGKNTYAFNVKVKGEMELVYSPDKPLSCGAKVWIETRGDIELDGKRDDTSFGKRDDTSFNRNDHVVVSMPNPNIKKIDREMAIFLIKKQKIIKNKNKLSA
tara:strand:+ start:121 stop:516 length:396 start_codon:yes stop_codon:yes gene_type:complete